MRFIYLLLYIMFFQNCESIDTGDYINCSDPEHIDFVYPNIILDNFEAIYDTSDIYLSWLDSEYCGVTEYSVDLNNRFFENNDYSIDWFTENYLELKKLDDGIWDLAIYVEYDVMDQYEDFDTDTFNFEFEIDQIPLNNLRLCPMYFDINEADQGSDLYIDLIVEELSVIDLSYDNILIGISGFGVELLVPTSLEFIEASQINDFFSNLDSFENSSGIDSYWQILPYDDLNYRLIFSFINNLNEEFTFTNETIILAKLKFQVSQIEINTDSLLIQFKPE